MGIDTGNGKKKGIHMKKSITVVLTLIITLTVFSPVRSCAVAITEIPEVGGATAVVLETKTGKIVYNKYMDTPMEPASTTKIMTALLALENLDLKKEITIDSEVPYTEGSRIYLVEGEVITVENLLYAMMTESANDCAVALAKAVAGSADKFALMMNKKAKEIGAENTHFVNPNGLHVDGHYSTAHDLALIAREAMKNAKFREIVTTYKWTVPATNKQPERYLYNTNRMLYDSKHKVTVRGQNIPCKYKGTTGIKTGYTSHAGGCLVAGAARDADEWIAVSLKSTEKGRFADCISLLDFAFSHYKTVKLKDKNKPIGEIEISKSKKGDYAVFPKENVYGVFERNKKAKTVRTRIVMKKGLEAPIKKGTQVGEIRVFEGKEQTGAVALTVNEDVNESRLAKLGIDMSPWKFVMSIIVILVTIFFLFILYRTHKINQKKKRIRKERERERRRRRSEDDWPYVR